VRYLRKSHAGPGLEMSRKGLLEAEKPKIGSRISNQRHNQQFQLISKEKYDL